MAGLSQSLRPNSSFSSSSSIYFSQQYFLYKLIIFLTILPIVLALFSFSLQWRGGTFDPITSLSFDHPEFPEMHNSPKIKSSYTDNCTNNLLGQSISPVFPYFRGWNFNFNDTNLSPKVIVSLTRIKLLYLTPKSRFPSWWEPMKCWWESIVAHVLSLACITTTTSAGLEQILPWIFYHKVIGFTNFFLFVEGKAASLYTSRVLESIPGVRVIYRTRELEEKQAKSRIWNESWLSSFFYKPCNSELFVKQTLSMEMAIVMARDAGMEWIFHLDTDELLHPAGTREYSVRELLREVPNDVDTIVFPNYESAVERDDIEEPFSEVSMFKKNYDHLPKEAYFGLYKESTRNNPNYFLTYGNGKAAARIQDQLRPNGAHRWQNYGKSPKEIKMDEAAVLHYTYSKFSDLTSRRDRCGCKPTKEDVKRCFMLEFDRAAFIIASTATEEEMLRWYQEHVVWNNGTLKQKLLKYGILLRIYAPMDIIQGLRESGVFASVIASAQTASSNKNNVASDNETDIRKSFSRKSSMDYPSLTRRMVLEEAIPPLSPPRSSDKI